MPTATSVEEHISISNHDVPDWVARVSVTTPMLIVGCGRGTLLDRHNGTYGIDYFRETVEIASERGPGRVIQGDSAFLPFDDYQFRKVLMIHSLEHFPRPLDAVKEARRVLQLEGELYIEVPNSTNLNSERDGHLYGWNRELMKNLLGRAGFELYEVEYFDHMGIINSRTERDSLTNNVIDKLSNLIFPNNYRQIRAKAYCNS